MREASRARTTSDWSRRGWKRYEREARRPLNTLAAVLPLVLVHELGLLLSSSGNGAGPRLVAHGIVQELLEWIGVTGGITPGLVLVGALIASHLRRREPWRVRGRVLGFMALESALFTVPLLVFSALFSAAVARAHSPLPLELSLAVGAGVYEEFIFRYLLIGALVWLLVTTARLAHRRAVMVAVGAAALLFSISHFSPIGAEPWALGPLTFRTAAGVYLSLIFLSRGLGVSAGCHVVHNCLLVLLAR